MSVIHALILGILQGMTEFLPVSSSAHLQCAKLLFGIGAGEEQVLFDLVCHLGTLCALLYYLRSDLYEAIRDRAKLLMLLIALLPLIPAYFFLGPLRDFASRPQYLGLCLLITSGILFMGAKVRIPRPLSTPSLGKRAKDAFWIGAMQSTALIPGISRSAATISSAQVLGWNPSTAVRFSFLLSIPTILGGNFVMLLKNSQTVALPLFLPCAVGFLAALGMGLVAIRFALALLERGHLKPFAWYCLVLGLFLTVYLNYG